MSPKRETRKSFYSRQESAQFLGICVRMVDHALRAGMLEKRRFGSRVLIPADSLERFAAQDREIPKHENRHDYALQAIGSM